MIKLERSNLLFLIFIFSLFACKDNDFLIEDKGIILPHGVEGAMVSPGHNRAQLSFLNNNEEIKNYEVFWDNRRKSRKINLDGSSSDTIKVIIEDLVEGDHSFEVTSYDKDNNSSTIIVHGKTYGDRYIASLKNRSPEKLKFIEGEDPYIEWPNAEESEVGIVLFYTDDIDSERKVKINKKDLVTYLPSYKENTSVKYKSLFLPEPSSIDTFFTSLITIPTLIKEVEEDFFSIKYVGPERNGSGDGNSALNAADFLDDDFWKGINNLLTQGSVKVKFIQGNYIRSYSERPLIIENIGHEENRLTLEGEGSKTIFIASTGQGDKDVMILIRDSQNIKIKNFNFTGNGVVQYVLRIYGTPNRGGVAKDILIQNCSWTDMRGVIYGATGAHYPGSQRITYKNCTFKRIGIDHLSHMIYNAYGSKNVRIINCHFEDCTGDYVRYRGDCDYGVIKESTFLRNPSFPSKNNFRFISFPLYNDVNPGDEVFATNYSITDNIFTNSNFAIDFFHDGFSPLGFNYLLTTAEGELLESGSLSEKKSILLSNFGINTDKIRLNGNQFNNIGSKITFGSFPNYGAVSRGWSGYVNISNLFEENENIFDWEIVDSN